MSEWGQTLTAAEEIMRLREDIDTYQSITKVQVRSISRLQDEIERLREALQEIYKYRTRNTLPVSAITLRNIARVALKESGDG